MRGTVSYYSLGEKCILRPFLRSHSSLITNQKQPRWAAASGSLSPFSPPPPPSPSFHSAACFPLFALSSSCRLPSKGSRSNLPRSNLTPFSFIRSLLRCPRRILYFATFVRSLPSFNSRFLALLSVPSLSPFSFFLFISGNLALYTYIFTIDIYISLLAREKEKKRKRRRKNISENYNKLFFVRNLRVDNKKNAGFPKVKLDKSFAQRRANAIRYFFPQ